MCWRESGCELSWECQEVGRKEDEVLLSLSKHTWEMIANKMAFSRIAKGEIRLEVKGGNHPYFLYKVIICSLGPQAAVLIMYCASGKIVF